MNIKLILLLFLILFTEGSLAATVHGNIYDLELNSIKNAIVKVNSVPQQFFVAKDGVYSFSLPKGDYIIEASYSNKELLSAKETISIKEDGDYVLDLILFPDLDEELLEEDTEIPKDFFKERNLLFYLISIIIILIIGLGVYFYKKRPKIEEKIKKIEEEKEDINKAIKFIKSNNGRVNQKDLRRHFGLSEAKISLLVAELEDKDLIKKIKKGRGNIIILKH